MSKGRRPLDKTSRKKNEKEVKKGQKKLGAKEPERTDTLTPKKALDQLPPKRQKKEKPLLDSTTKSMAIKKKKLAEKKGSKRTTPGDVDHRESPPAHIHPESEVWKETLNLQNKTKRKELTRKLEKRNSKRKRQP